MSKVIGVVPAAANIWYACDAAKGKLKPRRRKQVYYV